MLKKISILMLLQALCDPGAPVAPDAGADAAVDAAQCQAWTAAEALPALTAGQERLHNGVVIPYAPPLGDGLWPPRNMPTETTGPTGQLLLSQAPPTPYMAARAAAVLVDHGPQVYLDDFLVQASTGVTRTWHQGTPDTANPVLRVDQPWELLPPGYAVGSLRDPGGAAAVFYGGVQPAHDPAHPGRVVTTYLAGKLYTAYAYSDDYGHTWVKPNLGIISYDGSTANNLVIDHFAEGGVAQARDSDTMLYDAADPDPNRRWKLTHTFGLGGNTLEVWLRASPDGIHWSGPLAKTRPTSDGATVHFDPFRQKAVYSLRYWDSPAGFRRYRRYCEKPWAALISDPFNATDFCPVWDSAHWDATAYPVVTGGDAAQQIYWQPYSYAPEIYHRNVFAGPSMMYGFDTIHYGVSQWRAFPDSPKLNEPKFIFSRDGFHFVRVYDFFPFGRLAPLPQWGSATDAPDAGWDWGNKTSTTGPFVYDGAVMYHFSTGRTGWETGGGNAWSGRIQTGRWAWRRDGLASMDFAAGATLTTVVERRIVAPGAVVELVVNADADAARPLQVELLDATHSATGWTGTVTTNGTAVVVTWAAAAGCREPLSNLVARGVRIVYRAPAGGVRLYADQFTTP